MLKIIMVSMCLVFICACAYDLTSEQQALKLQRAQILMQAGNNLMNQGMLMTTPAINRYYAPPGTIIVPGYR